MSDPERIRISRDDVFSPRVDEILAREGSFGMRPDQFVARGADKPGGILGFLYSSIFYTALAGALGACAGWAIIEPFWGEEQMSQVQTVEDMGWFLGGSVLLDLSTAGLAAAFIGAVEGLVSVNWRRALVGGMIGLGVGVAGAVLLWIPCVFIYAFGCDLAGMLSGAPKVRGGYDLRRASTFGQILWLIARALAWAPIGLVVGLAPALHMRSKKLAFNGLVGGLIGAFLGGLLFNPINEIFKADEAWLSRCLGFTVVGLGAGMLIGLVENLAKSAWIYVQAGALAGKQFVLYKNPTVLGSSPKCEIFLFKDEAIEPKHAAIHQYGNRYEIEDLDSPAGTFVNGRKITRQPLKNGDRIYLGETVLDFSEKESD